MLKWFSADEGGSAHGAPGSPLVDTGVNAPTLSEVTERLAQMEELVTQLKELIREKDATLCSKDERLKVERDSYESKLSKIRLQNKAKVTSLNSQLEELRKNQERKEQGSPARTKQSGTGEAGDSESAAANRGKILRFRKKVEDLEQQVAQRDQELKQKIQELEAQRERGSAMDAMLADRAKLLTEKEAYIVHLQTALSGEQPVPEQSNEGSVNELDLMVQSLTKKVGDGEERCSLLQEQVDSFRELLMSEKTQFEEKENMYKSNIQTFKDIILQKDNTLMEIRQTHEQELFKLVAKSDASADLEQLLTALKQKLHEKEEVLLGKTQVIDVLQVEVDGRDQQIKELTEQMQHLQRERENLQSKLEAERHIARARLRDLMEKHEAELHRAAEKHNSEMSEKEQALRIQLETLQRSTSVPSDVPANPPTCITAQRITELEAHAKLKADEASKAEAKFLKMKAWSKARIRQLEEEFRKAQSGICTNMSPDVMSLRSRVTELEEEREEMFCKLELYEEMKAKNDELQKQLVEYEEQQRKMQADLEQVTKRAASQASETGSMDDFQNQVMEWQEMVTMVMESEGVRDQGHEKHAMSFRMSQIEEEREALAKRQQDVEEELAQAHGLHPQKSRKHKHFTPRSLQEDLEFDNRQSFPDPKDPTGCDVFMDGENMGGWWPQHGAADTDGLRSVVEELELERNQLQEQILGLEERCQDLEDRLQLQARIELLQNELERLQVQVTSLRSQQVKDAEKHQLLVTSLNEQLKGLNSTQECLESSLIEKEHTLAKTSEKLECIDTLREALRSKEKQHKDTAEKLLQTEHNLADVMKKCSIFEKENSQMKATVAELTHKISVQKDKMQKQEATIESLQSDLVQTNDELDRLNIAHLEERAQLIHDMQSCERRIDSLKDIITDKDKEILALSSSTTEYSEQIHELKQQIKLKEAALANVEPEVQSIRDPQHSDQQSFNTLIAELMEQLKKTESDLNVAKIEGESKSNDIIGLMKQIEEDKKTIQDLRMDVQKLNMNQKDQLFDSELMLEKELKSLKEERNKLLSEVTKHESELQTLSRELEEKFACQEPLKQDVQEKSKMILSLEQRLQIVQEEAEGERTRYSTEIKTRDETNEQLVKELSGTNENITKMKDHIESLQNDNQKLKDSLEENFDELEKQKQLLDNVKKELHAVQDQNSSLLLQVKSLTDENCQIKQIIETGSQSLEEKNILLNKISELELELLGSKKTVEDLCKEKEDLTLRGAELKKELEQSKQSMSEMLLEKSNECSQHSALLRESGEMISSLQVQVESLNNQVDQSNSCMAEKERTIDEKNALIESQKCQLLQLQEALTRFQEQEATLKSELVEKDGTMKSLKEECNQLTTAVTKQKSEIHNISKEFEEQVASQEQLKQDVQEKSKKILSLEQKLKIVQEEAEGERTRYSTEIMTRDEAMEKLEKELSGKNGSIIKIKAHFKSLKNDNQKLKESLEENLGEFVRQKQLLDNAKEDMHAVQDQSSCLILQVKSLTEDNCRLKQIIENGSQSLCDVSEEKTILLAKISEAELELLESVKTIEGLCKEKEDLTLRGAELKKELEQNKQSMSEMLLEKSNECSQHSALLRESGEMISSLQVQVESLNNQVDQSNSCMVEKENTIGERNVLIDSQKCQLLQLQEAMTQLNELEATLKSELMEKDGIMQVQSAQCTSLQSELQQQRQYLSKVQSEFDSLKNECTQLTGSLQKSEDRTRECQTHTDELRERSESVALLSEQLAAVNKINVRLESEIMAMKTAHDILFSDKNKLEEELSQIQAGAVRFHDHVQSLNSQNQQLQAMFEGKEKEVLLLTQVVSETNNKVAITTKENENLASQVVSLCEQNKNLQEQTSDQTKSLTEMTKETNTLQNKISILETQDVENSKIIEDLFKHMEGLLLQAEELKVFKQKQQSGAESLQEMSSECAALSKRLGEAEEEVALLKGELESSSSQIIHYSHVVLEKDKILNDQSTQMEAYQHQLEHLHKTLSILKEQANAHNSGLMEKDVLLQKESSSCSLLQKELGHERELVLNLQHEIESLKVECSRLNLSLEAQHSSLREKTLESHDHKEELVKRNEYVLSLTAQLGIINENNVKLKSENANLKCALEQHSKESARLKEELRQKQLELVEHQDITEQNNTIKSELKSSMAELFGQQEMIATLQSELATRNEKLASLKEQIETEHSGNDVLQLTLQEKEAALRAQEMHVNKLQDKLLESEGQIRQKIKVISELQKAAQSFQTALQDKDVLLLNKEQEFSLVKTELMAESEACKAQLKLEMDAVATLQGDLQNLLEKNKHLMSVVDEKDFLMRQEQEKYLCLQGNAAELENTKSQLNGQIKRLTLEATQLRETQTEKEQVVFAAQSQMQKLDELYKKLQEEYNLTKQELYKVINEKSLKEEEVCKLALEKEEISRNSSLQIQRIQEQVQHNQQQSVTMNDMEEEIKMEREQLHIQESMWGTDVSPEHWVQLHSHLQRSQLEIQQRDFVLQQLNIKLQQAIEEKTGVSAQLSTVSQMFRDTQETVSELQNRCYWLERQSQIQYSAVQQGSVSAEVPPGAPQERVSALHIPDASDSRDLRIRLTEAELHLSQLNSRLEEERSRREAAEEAVRLTEQRVTSMESNTSWSSQRDFSIELETDEEQYEALILDPNQHLLMRKMKSGVHLCRRWLKGRSTYCSKLLTSRAKSRYVFMAYLLTLHVLVFMCLSGAL